MEPEHAEISVRRQCDLLGVNRSGLYYQPVGESEENLRLMRLIDEEYTQHPFLREPAYDGLAVRPRT